MSTRASEPAVSAAAKHRRRLNWAFLLTSTVMVAEFAGGLITGSLSLLSDAGHMLTDAGGLGLALVAIRLAERPATADKTFGYHRAEVLAALANGIVLLGISGYVLYEAYRRFSRPPVVDATPMLIVAAIGLAVNGISMQLLRGGTEASLNVKAAYLEVLGDLLGSMAVIVGAVVMMSTGWYLVDPLVAAGIGLFILPRTWKLLRETGNVLLEGSPRGINVEEIADAFSKAPGVRGVHDLHVWTITSGFLSLTAHIDVEPTRESQAILAALRKVLRDRFGIQHSTLQIEVSSESAETCTHLEGCSMSTRGEQ